MSNFESDILMSSWTKQAKYSQLIMYCFTGDTSFDQSNALQVSWKAGNFDFLHKFLPFSTDLMTCDWSKLNTVTVKISSFPVLTYWITYSPAI